MRLCDAMTPARSWQEAALLTAQTRTMSGGAALGELRERQKNARDARVLLPENEPMPPGTQNAPAEAAWRLNTMRCLRRAAFCHVMRAYRRK